MNRIILLLLMLLPLTHLSAQQKKDKAHNTPPPPAPAPPLDPPPPGASIFNYVEQMPNPTVNLATYLGQNLHYPKQAIDSDIQGRVIVKFVVNEDGSISDVEIVRGISKECDAEAKRVVSTMPKWKPGMQNGKYVKVYFNLPIVFKLTDPEPDQH